MARQNTPHPSHDMGSARVAIPRPFLSDWAHIIPQRPNPFIQTRRRRDHQKCLDPFPGPNQSSPPSSNTEMASGANLS
ncbi:hypothetical protein Tco_0007060 [Tanacetum coccineum]